MKCFYCHITYKRAKKIGLIFHIFPDDECRNLWLAACKVKKVGKNDRLCSAHFKKEDYVNEPGYCSKRLRNYAVPTRFASKPGIFCLTCGEIPSEDSGDTYHCFPEDNVLRNKWKTECAANGFDVERVSSGISLCSKHFSNESFFTDESGKKHLHADAIPSILKKEMYPTECAPSFLGITIKEIKREFDLDENLTFSAATTANEAISNSGAEREFDLDENLTFSAATTANEAISNSGAERHHDFIVKPMPKKISKIWRPARAGDLKEEHFSTLQKAKRNFHILSASNKMYKRKINTLRQQNYYLQRKVKTLENLVSHLSDKNSISEETTAHITTSPSDTLKIPLPRKTQNKKLKKCPPESRVSLQKLSHMYKKLSDKYHLIQNILQTGTKT